MTATFARINDIFILAFRGYIWSGKAWQVPKQGPLRELNSTPNDK